MAQNPTECLAQIAATANELATDVAYAHIDRDSAQEAVGRIIQLATDLRDRGFDNYSAAAE